MQMAELSTPRHWHSSNQGYRRSLYKSVTLSTDLAAANPNTTQADTVLPDTKECNTEDQPGLNFYENLLKKL